MTGATETGHNGADAELKRRIDRRVSLLGDIAALQEDLKSLKAEDKSDGYDEKAIGAAVKSCLKGDEWHADQLAFEAVVDTYRRAAGLPVDMEAAQAAVRKTTAETPEPRERRRRADTEA
jgi:uncharacterized protein (UPF0335 family)